jgi:hypothetical protein
MRPFEALAAFCTLVYSGAGAVLLDRLAISEKYGKSSGPLCVY